MRELTSVANEDEARRLVAYLSVESIECEWEVDDGESIIWVLNDDDRDRATEILQEFRENPSAAKFEKAERKVRHVLQEADRLTQDMKRQRDRQRRRIDGSWWHCFPATHILIGLCVLVAIVCTDLSDQRGRGLGPELCNNDGSALRRQLYIVPPIRIVEDERGEAAVTFWRQPRYTSEDLNPTRFLVVTKVKLDLAIRALWRGLERGHIWRLVGPAFVHMSILHIFFNMMWLRTCGMAIEFVRGTPRFVSLCLILAVTSNVAQLFWSGPFFGGMSGVVFGLIGYVWMKGRTQPELGIAMPQQTLVFCIAWLILCMTGALGPIANAAHLVGFVIGVVIGARQYLWRQLPFAK